MPVTSKDGKLLVRYFCPRKGGEYVAWLLRYEQVGKFQYAVLRKPGTNITRRIRAEEVRSA